MSIPDVIYQTGSGALTPTSGPNLTTQTRVLDRLVEVSLTFRTCIAVIYFLTAIVAFVSNLLAILLLIYGPRRSRQLNQFLANLGASDILFAICNIPFTYITLVYNTWWLPNFLCPLSSFVQVLAPTVAFYTLIAIGIGRYFVIVTGHELLFLTKSRHTKIAIILIWLFAIILAAPILFVSKISPVMYENEHYVECSEDWSTLEALWPSSTSASSAQSSTILSTPSTLDFNFDDVTTEFSMPFTESVSSSSAKTPFSSSSSSSDFLTFLLSSRSATTTFSPVINDFSDSDTSLQQTSAESASVPSTIYNLQDSVEVSSPKIGQLYTIIVFVLTFILPVVTLTYLYGHIGLIVYKHQLPVGNDSHITNQNLTQTKIKVVKMLLILVISFIICWSPAQIFYLMLWVFEDIRQDTENNPNLQQYQSQVTSSFSSPSSLLSSSSYSSSSSSPLDGAIEGTVSSTSWYSILYYTLYFSFHWLSCAHTIINPFVYCFFSNNFQKSDLIAILMCRGSTPDRNKRRSVNLGHSSVAFARNNSLNANNNNNNNNHNHLHHNNNNNNNGSSIKNNFDRKLVKCSNNDNSLIVHKDRNLVHRTSMPAIQMSTINNNSSHTHRHHYPPTNDCVVSIRNQNDNEPYNDV